MNSVDMNVFCLEKGIKMIFVFLGAGFSLVLSFYLNIGNLQESQPPVLGLHLVK